MKTVMRVFSIRPEAIKMCPLVNELKSRENIKTVVCVAGQYCQMLDQVLEAVSITPYYDLSIMKDKQTLVDITTNILDRVKAVLEAVKPDIMLVHGDTTERPEGIAAGTLKLVGTEEEVIYQGFKELLENKTAYDAMAKATTLMVTATPASASRTF